MNVILAYLGGLLCGVVFTYGILAAQRKPPTPLAIREAEQIVAQLLK